MTGPTVAGSISAHLKLDTSDWDAKLAAADAAARKLGSVDPHIDIHVDDNGAVSKMAAVDAAAKELDGTTGRLDNSTKSLNATNGNGVQRWQLIAGAIAALIPLMGPLLGYAVGVGGALAGMGAAGVLAFIGIKSAIASGTVEGALFSTGLQTLKGDLDGLAATAAGNMLSAFQRAVSLITSDMPNLNAQIGMFSRVLGTVGSDVLVGVLNAFRILNPLFVQASGYVEQLAAGFQQWTSDGGLQRFASYAEQELPKVAAALNSLVTAAFAIIDAFAPVGDVMLGVITALGNMITYLAPILPAAILVAGAFKGWSVIEPIITGVVTKLGVLSEAEAATAASSAGLTLGIAGAAAGLAYFSGQMIDAARTSLGLQQSVDTLYSSLSKTSLKGLQQDTHAAIFGIQTDISSLGQITNSGWASGILKGTEDIYHGFLQIMPVSKLLGLDSADLSGHMSDLDSAMAKLVSSGHISQAQAAYKALAAQTDGSKQALANLSGYLPNYEAALKGAKTATDSAGSSMSTSADKTLDLAGATKAAAAAMDKFQQKLAGLGQVNLSEAQANIAYQQSLADTKAAIDANGKSTDLSTQAGRDNKTALDGIASSAIALVAAHAKAGDSTTQLTADMGSARQSFIDAAVSAGYSADEANYMADQFGLVPSNVPTAFTTSGAAQAEADAAAVKAAYDAIDRFITIRVNSIVTNSTNPNIGFGLGDGRASGGTIRGMADGGMSGTVSGPGNAMNDRAATVRLADGEEVISNMNGQASRWRPLLKAINANATPLRLASMLPGGNQSGGGKTPAAVNKYYNITINEATNAEAVGQRVINDLNARGAV